MSDREIERELTAMQEIFDSLSTLPTDAIERALTWACRRFGVEVRLDG